MHADSHSLSGVGLYASIKSQRTFSSGVGGVLGAEPIAPRGVPPVQFVNPISDDEIVRVLELASRSDLRGACKCPGKSDCLRPGSLQLVDFELEAARGTRRPGIKAESQKWVNSNSH